MAEQTSNGAPGRQAPRPPGSVAPDDGQWAYDNEDAGLLVQRLQDLQRLADEAGAYARDCRMEYAQAKRKAEEADLLLRAEMARRLRPQRTYSPPSAGGKDRNDGCEQQQQFAGAEREIPAPKAPEAPPKAPKEKKPRKPRKPKEGSFGAITGPLPDGQRSWFAELRRSVQCVAVPMDYAAPLNKRGLANKCSCNVRCKGGEARYVYVDPSAMLTPAFASATGPTAPTRSSEAQGWIVLDNREGAPAPQWSTVYPDVECARIAIEAALGIPDRARIGTEPAVPEAPGGQGG